jgi:predicted DNA-binding protein with PD1-like motif
MIFAKADPTSTYIGCLDRGTDVVASLEALCADKGVGTAFISGYGYLENPVTQAFSQAEKGYIASQEHGGLFVAPSIQGSISMGEGGKPKVILFFQGAASGRGRSKTVTGRLLSADVVQFEFCIHTVENVVLHRMKDKSTGLGLWLQMLPAGISVPASLTLDGNDEPDEVEEEEDFNEDELQIEDGDWLSHPRLGMCYVMTFDGEDRLKVRLQSGRIAELMMSMFRLSLEGIKDGGKVFKVEVRKKR